MLTERLTRDFNGDRKCGRVRLGVDCVAGLADEANVGGGEQSCVAENEARAVQTVRRSIERLVRLEQPAKAGPRIPGRRALDPRVVLRLDLKSDLRLHWRYAAAIRCMQLHVTRCV